MRVAFSRVVNPQRIPLYVNDAQTVLLTRSEDSRRSPRIVAVGEVRFTDGTAGADEQGDGYEASVWDPCSSSFLVLGVGTPQRNKYLLASWNV